MEGANRIEIERGRGWLVLGVGLLALVVLQVAAVISMNGGTFTYTLDDPYIHMQFARNLIQGHIGINMGENSWPCSSIMWPFALAPFALLPGFTFAPLIINTLLLVLIGRVGYSLFNTLMKTEEGPSVFSAQSAWMAGGMVVMAGLVPMVMNGMEHVLQVLFVLLAILGMVRVFKNSTCPWWLVVVLILNPLIRYESLVLVLPFAIILFVKGFRLKALMVIGAIIAILTLISLSFVSLGLPYLPSSILAKRSHLSSGLSSVFMSLQNNIIEWNGVSLAVMGLALLVLACFRRSPMERWLALAVGIGDLGFLALGDVDVRYEAFLMASSFVALVLVGRHWLFAQGAGKGRARLALGVLLVVGVLGGKTLLSLVSVPLAANNIYEQQYQIGRFAKEFYNKPVGVNDLGNVSYMNPNYVLDFWGLASVEALTERTQRPKYSPRWMGELAQKHSVGAAAIYQRWFFGVPEYWVAVADLTLGSPKLSCAEDTVTFFATSQAEVGAVKTALFKLEKELPEYTKLVWY